MKFVTDLSKGILGTPDSTELWEEIIAHIPDEVLLKPNVRILNVACGHCTEAIIIAMRMLALGISKEAVQQSIYLIDKYQVFTNPAKVIYGFTNVITADFLQWESDMKFNVVIGNPPFNKGDILLYPAFFKKSLNLAEIVVMIMPADIESQQVRLKKHNTIIKTHSSFISDNITTHFDVGIPDMRYIIATKSINNSIIDFVDPLTQHTIILPEHARLYPRRGHGSFSNKKNHDINGSPCITSVYRGNKIQWTAINKEVANKVKSIATTSAAWLVLVQEHPSGGLFNTAIIENTGVKWGSGIFALDANSKDDAIKLEEWLVSDIIKQEVQKLLLLKNTHSFSGPMMEKLPNVK